MPKSLSLYLKPLDPPQTVWFRRPDGTPDSLPALRLVASTNLMHALLPGAASGRFAVVDCVVDTGAHFSLVAERLWRRFIPGFVTPLPFDARTLLALRVVTIGGGTFPYTLGELTLRLENQGGNVLPATVVAKLTQDGGRLSIPLTLGLRGGFLEGRTLHTEADTAAAFGQKWDVVSP